MKVLLINPWAGDIFPPPSLGYLQSTIKHFTDAEVTTADLPHAYTLKDEYDIVGASFHSFSVVHARTIRDRFKGRLICGGHHPSAMPQQMLSIGYDQVCIGEGEVAIQEIIEGRTDSIIIGKSMNIDDIPFPDYTGFGGGRPMGEPVISSRGCPFLCSFCASSDFWKRKWRARSPQNVIEEIVFRNLREFMFEDDNFTLQKDRAIEICHLIKGAGRFSWQCASRAETLRDEDFCRELKSAGCHTVWLGIESLSQETLDRCNKNTTVEKMVEGIKTAERMGLSTMSQFIPGLPDDTEDNIMETVSNIKKYRIGRKGTNIAWVLPGTELYKRAKEKGMSDDVYLTSGAPFYTYEQNINTLNHWANLINTA